MRSLTDSYRTRSQAKEIEEGDSDADLDGPGDMDSF